MEFANPQALWLFLLIAGALYVHLRSGGKRDAALERFARDETRPHLMPPRDRVLKSARAFLLFAALVLCTVAAVRPQGKPYRIRTREAAITPAGPFRSPATAFRPRIGWVSPTTTLPENEPFLAPEIRTGKTFSAGSP